MPYEKKLIQFKDRQFVYACAVDLRTNSRKGAEKFSMQSNSSCGDFMLVRTCAWVFWSAHYRMTSVTGSNILLP